MASTRALLMLLLPPVSVLFVLAVRIIARVAARSLSALARAQFAVALPAGDGGCSSSEEVLRVASYERRRLPSMSSSCCKEEEGGDEDHEECVVCLSGIEERDEIRELKCRHLFHRSCLDRWLARRPAAPTCPLCRCRLLAPEEEEEEEEEASDMTLFMACVHGGHSSWWFSWSSSSSGSSVPTDR